MQLNYDEDEDDFIIELKDLLILLRKNIFLIIISMVVMASLTFLYTKLFVKPMYTSDSKICILMEGKTSVKTIGKVTEEELSLDNIGAFSPASDSSMKWILNDCTELIKSTQILSKVVEQMNLNMTADQLKSFVTAETIEDTRVIRISVRQYNAQTAKDIVDAIQNICIVEIPEILEVNSVVAFEEAKIPSNPSSPNLMKNILMGILVGMALSICLIIMLYIFNDKLKSKEDIEHYLNLSTLGVVKNDTEINEAYKTLRTNIQLMTGKDKKIISCVSYTNDNIDNVLKNLSISLSQTGKKVLFIDANIKKEYINEKGLTNYLIDEVDLEEIIKRGKEISYISPGDISNNSIELVGNEKFTELVAKTKNFFDYVVINTPPLGNCIDSVFISSLCDEILIIIKNNSIRSKDAKQLNEQLNIAGCPILGTILLKK